MSQPTDDHVEQSTSGRSPGTDEGTVTQVDDACGRAASRGGRPGATAVIDDPTVKVVAFEFAAGDELKEHAARHPVLIQVLRGRVTCTVQGREIDLAPGGLLHLTPMLRHAVRAGEASTLTVTMLLPHG
ncbi:cupin domain-containing protein [Arsenicicoccus dermatophilus]|uniref:cupin domain-containing protein n=1 Tax=Arsenicicoccus dermatophilus TaxID=1076331 RepID=UPI0039170020